MILARAAARRNSRSATGLDALNIGQCGSWLACDSNLSDNIGVTETPLSQASQLPHFDRIST
jgi:hypothetical protein